MLTAWLSVISVQAWQPDYILRVGEETLYTDCSPRKSVVVNGKLSLTGTCGSRVDDQALLLDLYSDLPKASTTGSECTTISRTTTPQSTGTASVNSSLRSVMVSQTSPDGQSPLVTFTTMNSSSKWVITVLTGKPFLSVFECLLTMSAGTTRMSAFSSPLPKDRLSSTRRSGYLPLNTMKTS
jgi:hypothetical protein